MAKIWEIWEIREKWEIWDRWAPCIKDTKHFLNKVSKDSYLVTLDVYTNIPNEGVNVINNLLQRNQSKATTVITASLWLILTLNNFNYLQLWEPNVQ